MFPCLCAQGSSIAEYLDFSRIAVKRDTCVLVCLYALRGFTRPSYISEGGGGRGRGGEGGEGGGRGGERGGTEENGVNASYTQLKAPQARRAPRAAQSTPSTENGAGYPPPPPGRLQREKGRFSPPNTSEDPSNTPPGSADNPKP